MSQMFEVFDVLAELRTDSHWVASATPRLSWKTATSASDWTQGSAEIELTLGTGSVKVFQHEGSESRLVSWPFAALSPREQVSVRIRSFGVDGVSSAWSAPLTIRAGFLAEDDWTAVPIGLPNPSEHANPFTARKEITLDKAVKSATLYATAHGIYQVYVNGTEVDAEAFKPGWTTYQRRLVHETTDITGLLANGTNTLTIDAAGGWFTENYGFQGFANPFYGNQPLVAAQILLEFEDGTSETLITDASWQVSSQGPRVYSGIYRGEKFDARRDDSAVRQAGYDTSSWESAVTGELLAIPAARYSPAVTITQEVPAVEVLTSPTGKTIIDFGQNLVGVVRMTVTESAGTVVTLRHAEVLEDGEVAMRPLRAAAATDEYVARGEQQETWQPTFTFHGFRYVEVSGLSSPLKLANFTALVIHSNMQRTGWFETSHQLLNKLHENVVWGMRGNFLSLPTDCPQRDERLGWTGDIEVFTPTSSYLFDTNGFLASWLEDLKLEQDMTGTGIVPFIVPDVLQSAKQPMAAWGDAATVVPYTLYERFRDDALLASQFQSMTDWVDAVVTASSDDWLWEGYFQFGDWLDPTAPADSPGEAKTDSDIVATAYAFRSADLVVKSAEILGYAEATAKYTEIRENYRRAFLDTFTTPSGRMMSDAQTGYALAVHFEIETDPARQARLAARLAELIRNGGYTIRTGFVGTPIIQDVLTRFGHLHTADRMLFQTANPSWLYSVKMGATTIWERWDSMLEDGSVNPGEMTSFNHYALGAVADWLHREVAGISPTSPAYRTFRVAPNYLDTLEHAAGTFDSPYGRIETRWERTSPGEVSLTVTVPPNTIAQVQISDEQTVDVGSGTHTWQVAATRVPRTVGHVSMQTPLSQIVEDEEAFNAIFAAIDVVSAERSNAWRTQTKWQERRALSDSFFSTPSAAVENVLAALEVLNSNR
ncbi:family 78 glycoside hydrolase catalytic domain [Jonesiaceae bacterium BS-20]|uniref:alpha-L-rhamnosidase n=1 Tax=Jonesiaceae bacterium BS-20 TaxID=3120821 RepID=A0AAU7DVY9_9MICO